MTLTDARKKDFDMRCYGAPEAELKRQVDNPLFGTRPSMIAISMLSDAQELISRGAGTSVARHDMACVEELDQARKTINCAKWVISKRLENEREVELKEVPAEDPWPPKEPTMPYQWGVRAEEFMEMFFKEALDMHKCEGGDCDPMMRAEIGVVIKTLARLAESLVEMNKVPEDADAEPEPLPMGAYLNLTTKLPFHATMEEDGETVRMAYLNGELKYTVASVFREGNFLHSPTNGAA